MGTVLGIDLATALKLGEALGYRTTALAELLPPGETGLLAGLVKLSADSDHEM